MTASAEPLLLNTSQSFFLTIDKTRFVPGFSDGEEVEFMPSVTGMPDLPDWMFYRFDNESGTGFLYGSPTTDGELEIEVIALNTHSFETQRLCFKLEIVERESQSVLSSACRSDSPSISRSFSPDFICL